MKQWKTSTENISGKYFFIHIWLNATKEIETKENLQIERYTYNQRNNREHFIMQLIKVKNKSKIKMQKKY